MKVEVVLLLMVAGVGVYLIARRPPAAQSAGFMPHNVSQPAPATPSPTSPGDGHWYDGLGSVFGGLGGLGGFLEGLGGGADTGADRNDPGYY